MIFRKYYIINCYETHMTVNMKMFTTVEEANEYDNKISLQYKNQNQKLTVEALSYEQFKNAPKSDFDNTPLVDFIKIMDYIKAREEANNAKTENTIQDNNRMPEGEDKLL